MTPEENIKRQAPIETMVAMSLARAMDGSVKPNPPGRVKEQDFKLMVPNKLEVKCDEKAEETGNIFFEVWNSRLNEPSGLMATASLWWAHYVPHLGVAYVFRSRKMREWLLEQKDYPRLSGCGDGNSEGYPVPIAVIAGFNFVRKLQVEL